MTRASRLRGGLSVFVFATATALAVGFLCMPTIADASAPSVSITSPTAGTTVKGTVSISATATAAAGDYITSISIYDGVNYVGYVNCQDQQTCTGSVQWQATGLSGQHTLTAKASANAGGSTTSAADTVNVVTPAPTVSITSPATGSTVAGETNIALSAATDPALSDYPTSISVSDGANYLGDVSCEGQTTCAGTVQWNATGLTGTHNLTATVETNQGAKATTSCLGQGVQPWSHDSYREPHSGSRSG